jgi:large subunit ribosomal protein L29
MKASQLRQKTTDQLEAMLLDVSREQFNLKMQKGTGQLAKPDQIKKVRREVARIQTILNEMTSA